MSSSHLPETCATYIVEITENIISMEHEAVNAYKITVVWGSKHRLQKTWNATVSQKQRYNALEAETERTPTVTKAAVKSWVNTSYKMA